MAKNLPDVSQKVVADAQQYINEFIRASKAQKSSSAEMSAEADKLVSGLKRKFGAADIGKEFLRGLGIGSGFAAAATGAELIAGHWKAAAEDAKAVAEQTQSQLEITRQIIELHQNEEQRLASLKKQQRDAGSDLKSARDDKAMNDMGLMTTYIGPNGTLNLFAAADAALKWFGVISDGTKEVAQLATAATAAGLAVDKAKAAMNAKSAAADDADFKQMQADLAAIAKEQAAWAKSQQDQADQAEAWAQKNIDAMAAIDAAMDAQADKWLKLADPMLQYRLDLNEIIRLQEKGKLTADEAADAMQALMEKNGQTNPAGTGHNQIFDDFDAARQEDLRKSKEWAEATKYLVDDVGHGITYAIVDSLNGAGDAWVNLKNMIIQQIEAIVVELTVVAPLIRGLGMMLGVQSLSTYGTAGAAAPVSAHAAGGDFVPGETMLVGEEGPEIVRFGSGGTVIPNHKIGAAMSSNGGGGVTVHQTLTFQSGVTRQELAGMIPKIIDATKQAVADSVLRGGGYRKAFA